MNQYIQFELFIDFILSLCAILYYLYCFRQMTRDRGSSLAYVDKVLCVLAIIQTFMQILYYTLLPKDIIIVTVRALSLVMQTLICNILVQIITNEQQQTLFWHIAKGCMGLVFMEWFWAGWAHQSAYDYNCVQLDFLILSVTGLLLAILSLYTGQEAIGVIKLYKEELQVQYDSGHSMKSLKQKIDQIQNRLDQIFYLHICGIMQFSLQFTWDLYAKLKAENVEDCIHYVHAESFGMVFIISILKFISLSTIPFSLFLVFYEHNKHQFIYSEYDDEVAIELQS